MPEWMHNRAEHILAKNPAMPKNEAFAIATQQMHALGKGPKGYGTAEGKRVAKAKFDTPKDDVKASNPGHLKSRKMENKTAGMRIDFGLDGRPAHAQTNDEWLAGLFKRDGSFMVPGMLSHAPALGKYGMAGFVSELEEMKEAGVLGDIAQSAKKALTTPIPGTPELFPHSAVEAASRFGKAAPAVASAAKAPADWRAARVTMLRKNAVGIA